MARALGGDHDDVDVLGGLDVAVVDIEAVRERQGVAGLQVRGNLVCIGLCLQLIGNQDHDEVGLFGSLLGGHDLEARILGLLPGLGALTQADAHVDAAVGKVQRMGMPLRAVADDCDLLALDQVGIAILIVVNRYCHGT